jgi:hypothetical protein
MPRLVAARREGVDRRDERVDGKRGGRGGDLRGLGPASSRVSCPCYRAEHSTSRLARAVLELCSSCARAVLVLCSARASTSHQARASAVLYSAQAIMARAELVRGRAQRLHEPSGRLGGPRCTRRIARGGRRPGPDTPCNRHNVTAASPPSGRTPAASVRHSRPGTPAPAPPLCSAVRDAKAEWRCVHTAPRVRHHTQRPVSAGSHTQRPMCRRQCRAMSRFEEKGNALSGAT